MIEGVPQLLFGNKPTDGGYLQLNRAERDELIRLEPKSEKWIKKALGATEFLNSKERWCLWLVDVQEDDLDQLPKVKERVESVRAFRLASKKASTRAKSEKAHLFDENRHPQTGTYILVPRHSSERRFYVPIGLFGDDVISTDANNILPGGTLYEFGVMTSALHNDWMRLVAGRLKSDYRYSASIVYNTFPWPAVDDRQRKQIEELAENILFTREDFPGKSLAELYNPETMPPELLRAHQELDLAVDKLYKAALFKDSAERLSFLLARYEEMMTN